MASDERAKSFLETPAAVQVEDAIAARNLEGQRIGSYQVEAWIGAGGMGEVYRARDTKLNRQVAIKVLLPAVADDPDRLARFSREAQVLASLNHPHIAQIYGLEDAGGVRCVGHGTGRGPDARRSDRDGAIPIGEALSIADADCRGARSRARTGDHPSRPEAREHQGPRGRHGEGAGLRACEGPRLHASGARRGGDGSPTLGANATEAGVILGTAAYMSPEQARGKAVDRRADLWAFGCVLYEMLTGRRAFDGETGSDMMAAVRKNEPDWTNCRPRRPRQFVRCSVRCLEKDRGSDGSTFGRRCAPGDLRAR